mmetsp:Transcript_70326/g.205687  ORF Transcript_70326/g.205687 Transcript_70326/m.205687 type:complete len:208 (-) Transcript_70326:843-1466(-)
MPSTPCSTRTLPGRRTNAASLWSWTLAGSPRPSLRRLSSRRTPASSTSSSPATTPARRKTEKTSSTLWLGLGEGNSLVLREQGGSATRRGSGERPQEGPETPRRVLGLWASKGIWLATSPEGRSSRTSTTTTSIPLYTSRACSRTSCSAVASQAAVRPANATEEQAMRLPPRPAVEAAVAAVPRWALPSPHSPSGTSWIWLTRASAS